MNLLIIILVIAIIVSIARMLPKSNCTGNCNQGRNCNCVTKE
jgi:hypothetical protein